MKTKKIKVTLLDEMLGMSAANPDIYREFIASKAPSPGDAEEEIEALSVDDLIEKSMTIFPKSKDGQPFLWDYQFRGFLKNALKAQVEFSAITLGGKVKISKWNYKRFVDNHIFVYPRKIPLKMPTDSKIDTCSRPLRAETMRGERVALAHSESVPTATTFEVEIRYHEKLDKLMVELLDYGQHNGIGQWHNSGKGRFKWEQR